MAYSSSQTGRRHKFITKRSLSRPGFRTLLLQVFDFYVVMARQSRLALRKRVRRIVTRAPDGAASFAVTRCDDVSLNGIIDRIRRVADRHGSFEEGSRSRVAAIATRSEDDRSLQLLWIVAG
jgi:hypothetical protein